MNCIKKFSRIVCVSLFSYQGCFAVISLRQLIYFIISFKSCQALFSKVFKIFKTLSKVVCFCRSVQATWLLYHKFSHLSTVNLNFLKTILFFSISEAIPCDSLFTIPLPQGIVKHFFTNFLHFFITLFSRSFFFNHWLSPSDMIASIHATNSLFYTLSPVWRFLCISSNHQH